ncbi:RNA helicase aquarius-like [Sycon ciliatum]|uniref:RNA helicase aquarius-like n=1 Tax=Sycon ciliatum TaxID=27933 RepID=UPI0031F6E7CA
MDVLLARSALSTGQRSAGAKVEQKKDDGGGFAAFLRQFSSSAHFSAFFRLITTAASTEAGWKEFDIHAQSHFIIFLNDCFNSLENDMICGHVQHLIGLPVWECLLPERLEAELRRTGLKKKWLRLQKQDGKKSPADLAEAKRLRHVMKGMIERFFIVLNGISGDPEELVDVNSVHYCERFLDFIKDIESLLPARRFFNTVLDDSHFVVRCMLSGLAQRSEKEGKLFTQLLDMLKFYSHFEINDLTGEAYSDQAFSELHYDRITSLQRAAFKHFPDLQEFALANVASVDTRETLLQYISSLSAEMLYTVAAHLHLVPAVQESEDWKPDPLYTREFLLEMLIWRNERRLSQLDALNIMPLYPTEEILWDENLVPSEYSTGGILALPKLNLQYLTMHDYLLRNLNLFRLESTYEIRSDIENSVSRMRPWVMEDGSTGFGGWARMAQPLLEFSVVEVASPELGLKAPRRVLADFSVQLNLRPEVKQEWENLRKHDVLFLVCVQPTSRVMPKGHMRRAKNVPFVEQYGIKYIRGCEIEGLLDEEGHVIEEGQEKPAFKSSKRTFRVALDTNQYHADYEHMRGQSQDTEDIYSSFNVIMRRKPKENNFKAVLETIRDLMNTRAVVPEWLHDIFLGYGDPGQADYSHELMQDRYLQRLDFKDTFLSMKHLQSSFKDYEIDCSTSEASLQRPPFRLSLPAVGAKDKTISVEPYQLPNRGPYPYNKPKLNTVPFTPTQTKAILSGMQPGLTVVVGPPGTGKTDVAVQIISNLYHNFPDQRTLIVTHSNQALNQIFEKIMVLDIEERHLLRLGHGEEELETDKDFSRYGRVNFILQQRQELLDEVQRLQESINVGGDFSYTCETAGHFFLYQIVARWEAYMSKIKSSKLVEDIASHFPFKTYFANAPQPVFQGKSYDEDLDIAEGCFRHIKKIFRQLEEFRPLELLHRGRDRVNYLLVKEARIIAMTCTHAALRRTQLVKLGFKYDNVLMEEAGQILEVETFIPLMLQNPLDGHERLKRVILIGDHNQLPPVIKNMAFQKYSNMEQSLFTRFVRLGVPYIELDAQGRARPSLARLYSWRYKSLGDLPHVLQKNEFQLANPGFWFEYQLINVDDYNGIGESEPDPFFFQNLAEAEYVVATYMYMRLQGYPAEQISILTTYNGQKHLIRDVLSQRCADNPVFGLPSKVTTVDRFQGQQNEYILLSLVRTKTVGHVRDIRRLVVAMSRARLGLYIFGRVALFKDCFELAPAFNILTQRPTRLQLLPQESFPPAKPRPVHVNQPKDGPPFEIADMSQMAHYVTELYHKRMSRHNKPGPASKKPAASGKSG